MLASLLKATLLLVAWGLLTAGDILEEGRFDNLNNETLINNANKTRNSVFQNDIRSIKPTAEPAYENITNAMQLVVHAKTNYTLKAIKQHISSNLNKTVKDGTLKSVNYSVTLDFVSNNKSSAKNNYTASENNIIKKDINNSQSANKLKNGRNFLTNEKSNNTDFQHIVPNSEIENRSQNEYLFFMQIEKELRKTNNVSHMSENNVTKEDNHKSHYGSHQLGKITFQYTIIKKKNKENNKTNDRNMPKHNIKNKLDKAQWNVAHAKSKERKSNDALLLASSKIVQNKLHEISYPIYDKKVTENEGTILVPSKSKRTFYMTDITVMLITDQCNLSKDNIDAINLKESLNHWCALNGVQLNNRFEFYVNNGE